MPTLAQIKWRMRGLVRRARVNTWRRSLSFAVVSCLVLMTIIVTVLTPHGIPNSGAEAPRDRLDSIGEKPTVIDGDTVRWQGRRVRLVGLDTPEIGNRARCQSERIRGNSATARLRELIASGTVTLEPVRCACPAGAEGTEECNFGRSCGVLMVNGRDAGHILIAEGLARPFQCQRFSCPPRGLWC